MDRPRDDHTKWTKSDRERQISYDITYMWNLKKNDTNELIYKTERQATQLKNGQRTWVDISPENIYKWQIST